MSFLNLGSDNAAVLAALSKSAAMIEFTLDGIVLSANENFCKTLGYELHEIKGKHHRIFVEPAEAASADYAEFWARLKKGTFDRRQYKRITKAGQEIWIEASYNPVFRGGKPYKVVKIATDITAVKLVAAENSGKIDAISRAQAVIEFTPTGEIITANENFLTAVGYTLPEIIGKHHSMFCEPDYVRSDDYKRFWQDLAAGRYVADEFTRIGKNGRKVFIQASYNPIFDMNHRVFKVVKYATDVTGRVEAVNLLGQGLDELSSGNLAQEITTRFPENLEKVRIDFNSSVARLSQSMTEIASNAIGIAAGTQQIMSASEQLAKRTEQQAASVEETAAALEQITTAVSDSHRRADEVGKLVLTTKQGAEQSGAVVKDAVAAMSDIENSSKQIANIIGVIDEIAFQTNLLALNAGVEAARAGDAGKGFAVVAQEVRELAQRSAQAAREIRDLIRASTDQVKRGVELVDSTGHALRDIVDRVTEITANVSAIVESSREQAMGLREVNQAVNIIDQGTQENAAMVEETTAATHSLNTEVSALNSLLSTFRTSAKAATGGRTRGSVAASASTNTTASAASQRSSRPPQTRSVAMRSSGSAALAPSTEWEDF